MFLLSWANEQTKILNTDPEVKKHVTQAWQLSYSKNRERVQDIEEMYRTRLKHPKMDRIWLKNRFDLKKK